MPLTDVEGDTAGARDIVGDTTFPVLFVTSDATHLYLRLRIDEDPLQNLMNLGPFGWGCFINTDAAHLKQMLVEFVCVATGGPGPYHGRDMKGSHAGMDLVDEEFTAVVENLAGALDHFHVGAREKNELLGALGPLKPEIVAPAERFHPVEAARLEPAEKLARTLAPEAQELLLGAIVAGGAIVAARGKGKPEGPIEPPFRLGKVQAEDLQVSVREVGVVDPVTKVDVKSPVSGRVLGLKVREGAVVRQGDVMAEIEPDVNQAQSLSEVNSGLTEARLRLQDAEREYASQKTLHDAGLIGGESLKSATNKRDIASEVLKAARMRYDIVEGRGIPISGNAALMV